MDIESVQAFIVYDYSYVFIQYRITSLAGYKYLI